MKQRITIKQLSELTLAQENKLRQWWKPEEGDFCYYNSNIFIIDYLKEDHLWFTDKSIVGQTKNDCLPLFSIGQCIEFLNQQNYDWVYACFDHLFREDIIDALWNEIKWVLANKF